MTSKQFYIMFFIFVISLKVQRLPCIIYGEVGKDGYLTFLAYLVVNIIGIILAFYILKKTKNLSLEQRCKSKFFEAIKRILLLAVSFYFLMQTLLLYESMQNLFEHTLFENLSWRLFSLLLLICVFYLASTGLKNLALNFELYFIIILVSYIILSVLGATTSNFSEIFPFETIKFKSIANSFIKFNLWFGDFFLVLFIGKGSKDIKLGWTLLVYIIAMLFVSFLFVVFIGIYLEYATIQSSLISMIAEQSMLGLNIGRADWFLILIAEMGTILSCAVCFFISGKCAHCAVPRVKFSYVLAVLAVILYLFDITYLVDTHTRQVAIFNTFSIISIILKLTILIILLIISISIKSKSDEKTKEASKPADSALTNQSPSYDKSKIKEQRRKKYEAE